MSIGRSHNPLVRAGIRAYNRNQVDSVRSQSTDCSVPLLKMADDNYFHADLDEVDSSPALYSHPAVDSVGMHVGMLSGPPRKGKWTVEEENYANKIIKYFNSGMLSIEAGTTLRSYLSDRLHW